MNAMTRRWVGLAAALAPMLAGPTVAQAPQSPAAQLIVAAKQQLTASACASGESSAACASRRIDSSAALLRRAIAQEGASNQEKLEAWIWLGIGQFFGGRDSVTRAAFREALAIDPAVQVNLTSLDSTLARIMEAERTAVVAARVQAAPAAQATQAAPPAPAPAAQAPPPASQAPAGAAPPADPVPEAAVDERPRLIGRLRITVPPRVAQRGVSGRYRVTVQAVVDSTGRAEPDRTRVDDSPDPDITQAVLEAVHQARFRPGRLGGRPVRVLIALPVDVDIPRAEQRRDTLPDVPPGATL